MVERLTNRIRFWLERLFVQGAQYRLLAVAALIGLISVAGGVLVVAAGGDFRDLGEAIWWAFLRLSDPGYLGDDVGVVRRTVSTILTVLGYVVFLGSLVAIMTQWLTATMRRLESGLTPVARNDHFLILGWTNRTGVLVRELMLSEGRVHRFLSRRRARDLHIVILAPEASSALIQELRERVGERFDRRAVTLRSGSPLRVEHLERVDFLHASVIIIPAADFPANGRETVDTHTIKTLLSLSNHPRRQPAMALPGVVAEIFDQRKVAVAERAYGGAVDIVASDSVISRLLAQNVRHPGLSHVYNELMSHGAGSEIYIREFPEFAGARVRSLIEVFNAAIPIGLIRPEGDSWRSVLNPPGDSVLEPGDRLILIAQDYERAVPDTDSIRPETESFSTASSSSSSSSQTPSSQRVLVLGWSHKVPALIGEFATYLGEHFEIDVASVVPAARRRESMSRYDIDLERIRLRQIEADYTLMSELIRLEPSGYDNLVMVGNDRLRSGAESDARTIVGYLLLKDLLSSASTRPKLLIELLDPENMPLLGRQPGEVIISPLILSHMLAQVALRRELRSVFDELFTAGGAEITFRSPNQYDLPAEALSFQDIQKAVEAREETALGLHTRHDSGGIGDVSLNPPRDRTWQLGPNDEIVNLFTYDGNGNGT